MAKQCSTGKTCGDSCIAKPKDCTGIAGPESASQLDKLAGIASSADQRELIKTRPENTFDATGMDSTFGDAKLTSTFVDEGRVASRMTFLGLNGSPTTKGVLDAVPDVESFKLYRLEDWGSAESDEQKAELIKGLMLAEAQEGDIIVVSSQNAGNMPQTANDFATISATSKGDADNELAWQSPIDDEGNVNSGALAANKAIAASWVKGNEEGTVATAMVKDGKLTKVDPDQLANGYSVGQMTDAQFEQHTSLYRRDNADGSKTEAITAKRNKLAEQLAPIEDELVGRRPTGGVASFEEFETRSRTWAKEQGLQTTANGFDEESTLAHDVGHPLVQEMIGMNSEQISKHFGMPSGELLAEESIVNVAEHLAAGDGFRKSLTNGARVVKALSRSMDPELAKQVRTDEFQEKLASLAKKVYEHDNYSDYMKVLRQGVDKSQLVRVSGTDFGNTAF